MAQPFKIYNTLGGKLEAFKPISPPLVGIYLCGPTVYGYPHLGHSRGPIVFDVLHRYLIHSGYKVRFVRNITDVGHLLNDADEGEDKVQKKARLEKLEPMEVAQHYTDSYNECLRLLNIKRPSIEPKASGHIIEQIEMIKTILEKGFAYEVNGSVYFDVAKYAEKYPYGELSGRVLEDLIAGAGSERRTLEGQEEKISSNDFALWKKAGPEHIMQWPSPWGQGFPGWHIECSAMSGKYLGEEFDIHAGGMDLLFPHHECEIAQSTACSGHKPVRYWMHNNMMTINGQKMAKSLDNGILLQELFTGTHHLLEKAYSPMTMRFFMLQAHYRSTVDFSNEALLAAEKGYQRLMTATRNLEWIRPAKSDSFSVSELENNLYSAVNEDLNTPITLAHLFDAVRYINLLIEQKERLTNDSLNHFKILVRTFIFEILGLVDENLGEANNISDELIRFVIDLRQKAKENRDFPASDNIRNQLLEMGIQLKDGKEGTTYTFVK